MCFKHKWIGNDIIFSFKGEISFDEIEEANCEIYGDSRYDQMTYAIYDFKSAKCINLTNKEIDVISALDNSISTWNRNLKLALIGNDKNSVNERILHYIKLMENNDWDIELFDHPGEAIEWCLT